MAQNAAADADECSSWRRQLSELQIRDVVAGTEDVVVDVVMWMKDEVVVLLEEQLVDVLFDDELVEVFDVEVDELVVRLEELLVDVLFDDELVELLVLVPDVELDVEVEVTLEDDDESGDSETQRT
jgi:hypothetical protein